MVAFLALLLPVVTGSCPSPGDVSEWLHLEPGLELVYEGHSVMDYRPKGQAGFLEKYTFTATWWLAGTDGSGRVRVMRATQAKLHDADQQFLSVEFFSIDPKTLTVIEQPRSGVRLGNLGPSLTKKPFPELTLEQLESDKSWVEARPLGGKDADHRITVTHPLQEDGGDVANVVVELEGPLPISREESIGLMEYDASTTECRVDLSSGHVIAYKSKLDVRFTGVTQRNQLDMKLARWEQLDVETMAGEVSMLGKVDELLGTEPEKAAELARDFLTEHPQSRMRVAAEHLAGQVADYVRMLAADKEEAKKLAAMVGTTAPDFTLEDLEGNRVGLRDLRGKIVLLSFWGVG